MKIEIPEFKAMAKCNAHLDHGPISIDLGDDVVKVIRCKNCGYYRLKNRVCMGLPTEPMVLRDPDDYCSRASEKKGRRK